MKQLGNTFSFRIPAEINTKPFFLLLIAFAPTDGYPREGCESIIIIIIIVIIIIIIILEYS